MQVEQWWSIFQLMQVPEGPQTMSFCKMLNVECKDNDKMFLFQVAIAFPAFWKLYNSRYMLWTRVWKRCRRWKIFELDCEDVAGVVRWIARGRGECVSLYWMYHNVSLYWWRFMYHNVLAFITSSSFSQIFI